MSDRPTQHADLDPATCGVCAGDVPPLIGRVLTGTGLTLDQAAQLVADGAALPSSLTEVQRRLVDEAALHRTP